MYSTGVMSSESRARVQMRPEIRFDHAWDRKSYDNGKRQSQLTIACDLIFHY